MSNNVVSNMTVFEIESDYVTELNIKNVQLDEYKQVSQRRKTVAQTESSEEEREEESVRDWNPYGPNQTLLYLLLWILCHHITNK